MAGMSARYGGSVAPSPRSPDRTAYGGPQVIRQQAQATTRNGRGQSAGLSWKPWTPPPIPTGSYNPVRDAELASSKLTGENALANIGEQRTAAEQNYNLGVEGLQRGLGNTLREDATARKEDTVAHNEAMAQIARSYQNLKAAQEQGANTAGVFSGGALLQAAAKRAANEGIANQGENTKFSNALAGIAQKEANAREAEELGLGKEALGKQESLSELGMKGTQAERNAEQEHLNTLLLEGREAADAGYRAPRNPNGREYRGGPEGVYRVVSRGGQYLSVTPKGVVFQRRPIPRRHR